MMGRSDHEPDIESLRPLLVEIGDGLQGQLHELSARPRLDACDQLLTNLHGAREAVARFRAALLREGGANGA